MIYALIIVEAVTIVPEYPFHEIAIKNETWTLKYHFEESGKDLIVSITMGLKK